MTPYLFDPRAIEAILALVAVEGLALILWRVRTGGGPPVSGTVANLSAGACLLLTLREALISASALTIAALLALALTAHGVDLATRWRATKANRPL